MMGSQTDTNEKVAAIKRQANKAQYDGPRGGINLEFINQLLPPKNGVKDYNETVENERLEETTQFMDNLKADLDRRTTLFKLEILLLLFLFNEDDGKISLSEKMALKNHLSSYKSRVRSKVFNELKKDKEARNLDDICTFIEENNINKDVITKALNSLRKISKNKEKYIIIIQRMESKLTID